MMESYNASVSAADALEVWMGETLQDARALVDLLTRARKRRGWTLLRLSVEAGVPYQTLKGGFSRGRMGLSTALQVASALNFQFQPPPQPHVLTAREAQHG